MSLSVFDMYTVGIGPSSSHTVGPMKAAKRFADALDELGLLSAVSRLRIELCGSLGATGLGHGSDRAVILGSEGADPATVDTSYAFDRAEQVRTDGSLRLRGVHPIVFDAERDLILDARQRLDGHPNAMRFTALDAHGRTFYERTFYSIGGGFILDEDGVESESDSTRDVSADEPFPFATAEELLATCARERLAVSDVVLANECARRHERQVRAGLLRIWSVMADCVSAGCRNEGVLPGGLDVRRRAPDLLRRLSSAAPSDPLQVVDWVNLFALAVNEENAAGGRVVTAPTNGAAGVVPAVLHYYVRFVPGADDDGITRFLLTAAAVGMLVKQNASVSGADVGCQGEIGAACAMAAAALCEVLGGTPRQVENAAEIGLEHNLGLTCDPIGGLVQVPCIERNSIAAVKAINAARLALNGNGHHLVSLDKVIDTMWMTGQQMHSDYKETARGGLAVNVVEC